MTTQVNDIRENAVCLSLKRTTLGNWRKVKAGKVQTDADPERVKSTKKLLESPELAAINLCDRTFDHWLNARCLPTLLQRGIYLVPITFVAEVNERIPAYLAERTGLVDKLVKAYPDRVIESKHSLKSLWSENDYLMGWRFGQTDDGVYTSSAEEDATWKDALKAEFKVYYQWLAFDTPGQLQRISAGLFEQERQKAAHQWQLVTSEMTQMVRAQCADWANGLLEQFQPSNGKKVRLQQRTLDKFNELIDMFLAGRNIAGDAELMQRMQAIKAEFAGISAKNIRDDEALRTHLQNQLTETTSALRSMIANQPTRQYFADGDAASNGAPAAVAEPAEV